MITNQQSFTIYHRVHIRVNLAATEVDEVVRHKTVAHDFFFLYSKVSPNNRMK